MKKRGFGKSILACCFILGLTVLTFQPAFPAKPGIDINNDWGAFTWTSNAASPTTMLNHEVIVVDHDGIADDGSSHTVTVKYPDGQTKVLQFSYKTDAYHAVYHLWDSVDPGADKSAYTGDYVYHVTDVSTGESSEATDHLDVDPINPPDETTFSPKFDSPQSITAYFDNVYVNGSLYDDFDSGFDPTKWQAQPSEVTYENGEARFEEISDLGHGSTWLKFINPDTVNSIKTTVKVTKADNIIRARTAGYFCHDSEGDVWAQVGIRGNEAVYGVETDHWEGDHIICKSLVPLTSLGSVTMGNRYDITIDWDGTTFTFTVHGLDDTVSYSQTYTPSGPISPTTTSLKGIGVAAWLVLDTTSPTFNWDPVSGANHYRVRIYGMNDHIIYTGYTKAPPYTVPPGILKPNAIYKYRIYAHKEHQWFEADNVAGSDRNKTLFVTGPDEAQSPYVDLASSGVSTWAHPSPYGTYTYFYLKIDDAQGVPGNIESVKAVFPDGSTKVNLYPDYNETSTCAVYRGIYFGSIQGGEYTITVMDKDGNSDTRTETLTPDPIGAPSESSLVPADNTVVGNTGVSFDWADVPGAAFYELKIYDKDAQKYSDDIYSVMTTSSEYTLPPGILEENSQYRYQVYTRREFFEDNEDNGSCVPFGRPWEGNTFFTTETSGTAVPSLDISTLGVAVAHAPQPATDASLYYLEFGVKVTDADGVPENIKSVEVTYPDGTTKRLLKFNNSPDWDVNYLERKAYTDASSIHSGVYSFKVVDFDGHVVTLTDTLSSVAGNVLPWPENVAPADGQKLSGTTPLITWDPVPGASYYKVKIMGAWPESTIHWSGKLTQTGYPVPSAVLDPDTTYSYRVYAFREASGNEVDFYSCNRGWDQTNYRFTTGKAASEALTKAWNLISLYLEPTDTTVDTVLADINSNISSAWKWQDGNWAVYLPGFTQEQVDAYLASKGFSQMTDIACGEGFWVNSTVTQNLTITGTQPSDATCSLPSGWNLIGLKSSQAESVTDLVSGKQGKIASVWAWVEGNWAVYLPGEDDGGATYAGSKGFTVLEQINPGEGFWVNCTEAVELQ